MKSVPVAGKVGCFPGKTCVKSQNQILIMGKAQPGRKIRKTVKVRERGEKGERGKERVMES